jgi:hypothetical protein
MAFPIHLLAINLNDLEWLDVILDRMRLAERRMSADGQPSDHNRIQ